MGMLWYLSWNIALANNGGLREANPPEGAIEKNIFRELQAPGKCVLETKSLPGEV
jgi:hypothetical protein